MPAYGSTPIGMTPFGFSTDAEGPAPPLRRVLAPFVDPFTKHMTVNADGELDAMSVNMQRVLLTCTTVVGSSSVLPKRGITLPTIIDESFEDDAKTAVAAGLQYMVDDGSITIDSIVVTRRSNGQPEIAIKFTDHQRGGTTDEATIYV